MTELPCADCGEPVEVPKAWCSDCMDHEMPPPDELHQIKMIEAPKLRELIEEWRWENAQPAGQQGAYQVAEAFEKCANQLEALLDDET